MRFSSLIGFVVRGLNDHVRVGGLPIQYFRVLDPLVHGENSRRSSRWRMKLCDGLQWVASPTRVERSVIGEAPGIKEGVTPCCSSLSMESYDAIRTCFVFLRE